MAAVDGHPDSPCRECENRENGKCHCNVKGKNNCPKWDTWFGREWEKAVEPFRKDECK